MARYPSLTPPELSGGQRQPAGEIGHIPKFCRMRDSNNFLLLGECPYQRQSWIFGATRCDIGRQYISCAVRLLERENPRATPIGVSRWTAVKCL